MKEVQVKNLIFNDGNTKLCVPLIDETLELYINSLYKLKNVDHDLIELRIDYFKDVEDFNKVIFLLKEIKNLYNKPILFTFRTKKEGGIHELSEDKYFELNNTVIQSKLIDIVDIELSSSIEEINKTIALAHYNNVKVIISNHDFIKTPSKQELINKFLEMEKFDGDISKIAVMANCEEDVLTLLEASLEMKKYKATKPFIIMSMGSLGIITRLTGELFGSCMTFAALEKTSAPGQINVTHAREILKLLNKKN